MDNESMGQYFIFVSILLCIFFFTYCAIPTPVENRHTRKSLKKKPAVTAIEEEPAEHQTDEPVEKQEAEPEENLAEEKVETSVEKDIPVPARPEAATGKSPAALSVIQMNNPKYEVHKKGIVAFTHEKHVSEYAIACGSCHHDDKGTPLELTYDDPVQNCIECHVETVKPKGEKLSKPEKIAKYHFEALHANCISCHKKYNIEKGDPKGKAPAPTSCTKCHPKNK